MVSSNLQEIMETRKISYRELERLSGVSLKTIYKARRSGAGFIETCTLSTLSALAKALDVCIKDLFTE